MAICLSAANRIEFACRLDTSRHICIYQATRLLHTVAVTLEMDTLQWMRIKCAAANVFECLANAFHRKSAFFFVAPYSYFLFENGFLFLSTCEQFYKWRALEYANKDFSRPAFSISARLSPSFNTVTSRSQEFDLRPTHFERGINDNSNPFDFEKLFRHVLCSAAFEIVVRLFLVGVC